MAPPSGSGAEVLNAFTDDDRSNLFSEPFQRLARKVPDDDLMAHHFTLNLIGRFA